MNTFKINDHVKVVNLHSPFHNKTGKVHSVLHHTIFIKFDGTHGQPIGFDEGCVVFALSPSVDDLVRITKPTGKWTGQEGQVISVYSETVRVDLDYEIVTFEKRHVEIIESFGPKRVEGAEIDPSAIKVGDEILVTRVSGGMTQMRQGVVAQADRHPSRTKNPYLFNVINSNGYTGARLNWNEEGETYTLVKAAPEVDTVLESLKAAGGGTAVYFNGHVARKSKMSEWWDVYSAKGLAGMGTTELRELIGKLHFQFLKPEGPDA